MGNLTDDMTRLRGEVDALRSDRGALMQALSRGGKDLASSVLAMRADFGAAHAAMARDARDSRAAFASAVSGEVNALLVNYRRARGEMAFEGSKRRAAFCVGVRKYVAGMCLKTADDLAGARLAWSGRGGGIHVDIPLPKWQTTFGAPPTLPTVEARELAQSPPPVAAAKEVKEAAGANWSGAPRSVKKHAEKSRRTERLKK